MVVGSNIDLKYYVSGQVRQREYTEVDGGDVPGRTEDLPGRLEDHKLEELFCERSYSGIKEARSERRKIGCWNRAILSNLRRCRPGAVSLDSSFHQFVKRATRSCAY